MVSGLSFVPAASCGLPKNTITTVNVDRNVFIAISSRDPKGVGFRTQTISVCLNCENGNKCPDPSSRQSCPKIALGVAPLNKLEKCYRDGTRPLLRGGVAAPQ